MENEEKECPACARCEVSLSDYPNWCRCNSSALRDCVNRLNNYDAGIVFGMHFGDPDFVLEGDPNPAKENILFFKADRKYVYLEFLTMGDENAPKEHIPIVRMCKPCVAFMGEYFWSKYLPKEFWEGYEQAVLHTLKRLVDDPSVESDADLIKYAREIVHGDMLIDW